LIRITEASSTEEDAMPRVGLSIVVLMLSMLLASNPVSAGDEMPKVSWRTAIAMAMAGNDELKAATEDTAAKKADIGVARGNLLPKLSFEERFLRTDNPSYVFSTKINQSRFTSQDLAAAPQSFNYPEPISDFQTLLSVEQSVFARKAQVGMSMAKNEYQAKNEELTRKKEEIVFKVVQSYLLVHTSRAYVGVIEQAVTDSKEHLRIAELRNRTNLGLYSDILRASTALKESEQKLVSARKGLNVARRALGLILGRHDSVDVEADLPDLAFQDVDYYTRASLARKDLKSLEIRYENAKKNIQLAEAEYYPLLGVGGALQWNDHSSPFGSDGDSWQVMAFLRWNLFDGAKREYERSKAKHQMAQVRESLSGLEKAIAYQVYEAHQTVEEAGENAELARAAFASAAEGARLVQVRFTNSLSPLVDLLDAQLSLNQARTKVIVTENEYRIALANLGFQSGTLLQDLKVE
jgi:outer membrane protein